MKCVQMSLREGGISTTVRPYGKYVQLDSERHADCAPKSNRMGEHLRYEERRECRIRTAAAIVVANGHANDTALHVRDASGGIEPLSPVGEDTEVHRRCVVDEHAGGLSRCGA